MSSGLKHLHKCWTQKSNPTSVSIPKNYVCYECVLPHSTKYKFKNNRQLQGDYWTFEAYALIHLKNTLVLDNTGKSPLQMVMTSCDNKWHFISKGLSRQLDAFMKFSGILIRNKNTWKCNSSQLYQARTRAPKMCNQLILTWLHSKMCGYWSIA